MDYEQYMRTVYETRRQNLYALAGKHGGITFLAEKAGFTQSWMSQLRALPFSEKVARRIEERLGLKYGFLDKQVKDQK